MPLKDSSYHVALIAVLGVWSLLPVSIANYLFYLLILVVTSCIARAGYEHAKLRREAWLGQYLKASSTLRKRLAVGVISGTFIFLLAVFLSVILLLNLRSGGFAVWGAVPIGFLVFQWSTRSVARKLQEHVLEGSVAPIVRKVSTIPAAMIMIVLSLVVSLSTTHPDVTGMSWLEVMGKGATQIEGSGLLAYLELLHLSIGLTEYWAIQNTIETLGTPVMLNVLGWTLFFISKCAFVWAFCRLMVGVDSLRARLSEQDV